MNINHYSYKGIGETVLTFKTYKNLNKGDFIRLDSEGTAVLAELMNFIGVLGSVLGVVLAVCEDHVSVLVKGFIELPMSSASAFPATGYQYVVSDGKGGVLSASTGKCPRLVVSAPVSTLKAGIIL